VEVSHLQSPWNQNFRYTIQTRLSGHYYRYPQVQRLVPVECIFIRYAQNLDPHFMIKAKNNYIVRLGSEKKF
jgi:hypothetical protein